MTLKAYYELKMNTDTEFLNNLPQRDFPRGFSRELTDAELSRLTAIAVRRLLDADCVHRPDVYGNVHEARMLLATEE